MERSFLVDSQNVSRYRRKRALTFLSLLPLGCLLLPRTAQAQSSVEKLQEFPLDQVQVTDSYQKNLFTKDVTYLITTLDSDRLMSGFKAVSQGTTATNLYGGWENTNIRGHTMGHWLSAVAHAYAQAKGSDPTLAGQIKTKLDDVISKLKTYQLPSGFLFATPLSQFDDFDAGTGSTWVPYYTMHKILAGLIDVYALENNADALAVASKLGDWLYTRASGWNASSKSRVLSQEYGGMNDALYELYKYTKSANHLNVAHIFDDTGLFTTLAAGTDNLNGKHANMTIPKFIGALNRYRTLGANESAYLNAASGFFGVVLKNHTYVTGGNSQDEHFHVAGQLDATRDAVNNETCNAYNMSKLTRDLFRVTADVKYADFYERIHINEILSSIHPETGMTTYFKAMGTGYFKAFGTPTNSFWCCTGTGMENFTRLGDSVYFHDASDLWVTYYVSSTLNWKERGFSLTQTTDLPFSSKVTFKVTAAPLDAVTIKFRKPYWLAQCQPMTVSVNSQSANAIESNGFLSVNRVWQVGDQVELTIPADVQVSRLPDNQNAVAFTYGPLTLSAGLGTASMTTTGHAWTVAATKPSGLQETITINSSTTINSWLAKIKENLVQTAGKLEFTLKNTDSDSKLVFVPHFSRYLDRYGIYWKLAGTTGSSVPATSCPATGGTTAGTSTAQGGSSNVGSGGRNSGGTSVVNEGGTGGTSPITSQGGTTADPNGTPSNQGGRSTYAAASSGGSGASLQTPAGGKGTEIATGGNTLVGTSIKTSNDGEQNSSGCSCKVNDKGHRTPWTLGLILGLGLVVRRRNRRRDLFATR
jgi:MYXO-CTERM domain-containing protein